VLNEVIYFGLIMPSNQLEEVLGLADLIRSTDLPLRVRIIGTAPTKYATYATALRSRAAALPIVWEHNLSDREVGERLACASLAYLPYVDGASDRRATLRAALANGVSVITTRGTQTPSALQDAVMFCENPREALAIVRALLDNPRERSRLSHNAKEYGRQFTWEKTAKLHLAVYQSLKSNH
jgi:glycosyltransferase involved in cell wall biosynthesis